MNAIDDFIRSLTRGDAGTSRSAVPVAAAPAMVTANADREDQTAAPDSAAPVPGMIDQEAFIQTFNKVPSDTKAEEGADEGVETATAAAPVEESTTMETTTIDLETPRSAAEEEAHDIAVALRDLLQSSGQSDVAEDDVALTLAEFDSLPEDERTSLSAAQEFALAPVEHSPAEDTAATDVGSTTETALVESTAVAPRAPVSDARASARLSVIKNTCATSKNPRALLTKTFERNKSGKVVRTTATELVEGRVRVVDLASPQQLAELISNLGPQEALMFGVPRNGVRESALVSRARARKGAKGITRTNEQIGFPEQGGLLYLDFDHLPPDTTLVDVALILTELVPAFGRAPMVLVPSASSLISDTGTGRAITGLRGVHAYVWVESASEAPEIGARLRDRMILNGRGWCFVSKPGGCFVRVPFDETVFQPTRLAYAAGAVCSQPLVQRSREPLALDQDGLPLSLTNVPPITEEERKRVETLEREIIESGREESETKRAPYREARIKAGVDPAVLDRMLEHQVLEGDFPITLVDGSVVTVREILADPNRFHGRTCYDPEEPDYQGGKVVGKIYAKNDDGTARIYSFAHGGRDFVFVPEARDEFGAEPEAKPGTDAGDWERPLPIVLDTGVAPFPLDSLPPQMRRLVESVATSLEVPVDFAAIVLLGAVAGAGQRRYTVRVTTDYREPLCLYLIVAAASGERKTPVTRVFRQPFDKAQEILRERMQSVIARAEAELEQKENEKRRLLSDISSIVRELNKLVFADDAEGTQKRDELLRRKALLEERATQLSIKIKGRAVPPQPLLWLTEGTPEAVAKILSDLQSLMVFASEGDLIDVAAGQYSDKTGKLGILLSAYSMDTHTEGRVDGNREAVDPRLTIILAIQPAVVEKLQKVPEFGERGLTPRFLYASPPSKVGSRTWNLDAEIDTEARDTYQRIIGDLLDVELTPPGHAPPSDLSVLLVLRSPLGEQLRRVDQKNLARVPFLPVQHYHDAGRRSVVEQVLG